MPDIDQQKDCLKHGRAVEIAFHQLSPLCLFLLGNLGIAVSGKIHQIHFLIDTVKIDGLRLPRRRRDPGIGLPIHQRIDQGRLPYVGFSRESHLRLVVLRKPAGDSAYGLQVYIFNYHIFLLSVIPCETAEGHNEMPLGIPCETAEWP